MKSLNVFSKLIPLVLFVGLIGQAHADFPTPPWTKRVSGSGKATGPKSSACPQAERAAKAQAADKSDALKAECEKNKGSFATSGDSGGLCMYYNPSGPAIYDFSTSVRCSAK